MDDQNVSNQWANNVRQSQFHSTKSTYVTSVLAFRMVTMSVFVFVFVSTMFLVVVLVGISTGKDRKGE